MKKISVPLIGITAVFFSLPLSEKKDSSYTYYFWYIWSSCEEPYKDVEELKLTELEGSSNIRLSNYITKSARIMSTILEWLGVIWLSLKDINFCEQK